MLTTGSSYQLAGDSYTIMAMLTSNERLGHQVYRACDSTQRQVILKCATTTFAASQLHHEHKLLNTLRSIPGIPHSRGCLDVRMDEFQDVVSVGIADYIDHSIILVDQLQFMPDLITQVELLPDVTELFKQAVNLLHQVYNKGIIHGDLKLQNFVIDQANHLHIIDWDHGCVLTDVTTATVATQRLIEGTPQYMAPEQARGESIDQRADIYALGMICIALTYGSALTPLYDTNLSDGHMQRSTHTIVVALRQNETAKYQLLPLPRSPLEAQLQAIWQRMTQPDRSKRYQHWSEIIQEIG